MSGIFISYRRCDTAGHAGRLCDGLRFRFGRDQVFMDLDTIPPGSDFVDVLEEAVASCDALVVLMGREWLDSIDDEGQRRLDDPGDLVRLEIGVALRRNTLVIPVLVEGAKMPSSRQLPDDIAGLARHNALDMSDARWDHDINLLVSVLEKVIFTAPTNAVPGETTVPAPSHALDQVFPGNWNVQLRHPAVGMGYGTMMIDRTGRYEGRVTSPLGRLAVNGQWRIVGPGQVQMVGLQSNGIQTLPYELYVQFASISPNQLVGNTSAGETVVLVRAG